MLKYNCFIFWLIRYYELIGTHHLALHYQHVYMSFFLTCQYFNTEIAYKQIKYNNMYTNFVVNLQILTILPTLLYKRQLPIASCPGVCPLLITVVSAYQRPFLTYRTLQNIYTRPTISDIVFWVPIFTPQYKISSSGPKTGIKTQQEQLECVCHLNQMFYSSVSRPPF